MRIFLGFLVVVAVAGGILSFRKNESPQVKKTHWTTQSIERATDVKRQVADQQKEHEAE